MTQDQLSHNDNSIQNLDGIHPDQAQVVNQQQVLGNLLSEGIHNRNFSNDVSSSHTARKFKNNRALKKAYSGFIADD